MGILSLLLGNDNPAAQWANQNSNFLGTVGAGLAQGTGDNWYSALGSGLAAGARGIPQARQADQDAMQKQEAENQTIQYLKQTGNDDLVPLVAAGQGTAALQEAFSRQQAAAQKPGPIKMSEGDVLLDPTTNKPIYSIPKTTAASTPAAIQEYQYAVSQGFKGTFAEYETQMRRAGATNLTFNNDQANAAGFADRMKAAEPVLEKLEQVQTDVGQNIKGSIWGVGNFLTSPEYQQAQQAQRDFVNAVLRKESGAAISEAEFENARKQYFPQPGDSPQVIAQKRQNRAIAIASMERSGGPAYLNPNAAQSGVGSLPNGNVTSSGIQWSVEP